MRMGFGVHTRPRVLLHPFVGLFCCSSVLTPLGIGGAVKKVLSEGDVALSRFLHQ